MPTFSSPERFDAIRDAHPMLGFGVYALERGALTLEVYTADGRTMSFRAPTLGACLDQAFGPPFAAAPAELEIDLFR